MATRPRKPSPPAERTPDNALGAVLDELREIRRELGELRDEVRAIGQRRVRRRGPPGVDPGDAVPPGVAVQDPAPLSPNDRKARRNLERLSRQG